MVTRNPLLTTDNTLNLAGWINRIIEGRPQAEQQAIIEACTVAQQVHQSQTLPSGQPYLVHVITVADILVELGMDTEVLVAAILHDIVGHKQITLEEIGKRFGLIIMRLVDGVNKMKNIETLNHHSAKTETEDHQTENFRKMLLAMSEDVRVVLIKLADRLDYMHSLQHLPEAAQQHIARETLDLFAPLANRLGIWQIKWELEDLSLRYLEPETYQRLARLLAERRVSREKYIEQVVNLLRQALTKAGIHAEVSGRPKHIYSIWRKMQRKGLDFDQIFDVRAVRVLVNTINECYMTLGIIHNLWQPIPGEFDDYIAKPKHNNYQSLHTAVLGPEQKIFEVQIRTQEMHHHAELGIASHWRYKEGGTQHNKNFELKIAWLRQLLRGDDDNNPNELIDRFKSEIFEDTVYVLTPQGKVVELPQGATPLDFAYYIHTQLGHRCRGAKVNHRLVPLTYNLKSGEQVEILASKEEKPSRDWLLPSLGYLKTPRARNKVRLWFKKQNIQQHINDGRQLLERELRRLNIKDYNLEKLAHSLNFKLIDDLLASLGRSDTTLAQIANFFQEQILPARKKLPIVAEATSPTQSGVYVQGVGKLLTQMAGCCKPLPYDPIVGYVSKGRGVMVHRRDCYNALRWQGEGNERLLEVQWSEAKGKPTLVYPVDIQVNAYDRTGLLQDICAIVANAKINIIATTTLTDKTDNSANMTFTLEVSSFAQLREVLAKIDNLPNVMKVWRKT